MAEAITVHCPSCDTGFPVDPSKVPSGGVRARCSVCSDVFPVEDPRDTSLPIEPAAVEPPRGIDTGAVPDSEAPEGDDVAGPGAIAEEDDAAIPEREKVDGDLPAGDQQSEEESAEEPEEDSTSGDEDLDSVDYFFGSDKEDEPGGMETAGKGEGGGETGSDDVAKAGGEADLSRPAPSDQTVASGPDLETTESPPDAPSDEALAEASRIEGEEVEGTVSSTAESGTGADATTAPRPTFGQRSPEEKAHRLARVLVSDMITYNPRLYEEALDRGTLKEDFEEEIAKSWKEYVEQVGEELATSTPYWKDALNDILAKGEEIF